MYTLSVFNFLVVWCTSEKKKSNGSGYCSFKGEESESFFSCYVLLCCHAVCCWTNRVFQQKAKLSCLVVKCQERNCLLVEMMKSMQNQCCLDPRLIHRVKHLLRDAALQEYAATFTPGSYTRTGDCCDGLTQDFVSAFQDYTSGFIPDETCQVVSICVSKQETRVLPESKTQYGESRKHVSRMACETSTNLEVGPAAVATLKKNTPELISPVPEPEVSPVVPLKDTMSTSMSQVRS